MEEKTERAGRKRKTLLVFIAVFAVLAAIAAALYAAYQQNLFGFGDIVNNSIHAGESTDADVGPDSDGVSGEPVQEDFYLPMSIYTPEHRAAEQWFEFIDSYDISWRSEMGMEEPYMAYSYEPHQRNNHRSSHEADFSKDIFSQHQRKLSFQKIRIFLP